MKPWMAVATLLLAGSAGFADVVHLNDGSTVEGTIKRARDGYVVTDAAGKTTLIPDADVKSVELKKTTTPNAAEDRLASLRRAVTNLDDIRQIIDRYKSFVAQAKGTPAGKEAEQDLAGWQAKLDKHMVKAGKEWVTSEQFEQFVAASRDAAARALPLLAAGQTKEATAIVDQGLAVTPNSPELLYLKGVLLYRQSQWVASRNAFQAAAAQRPDHGPTHNNVGVILWKTRPKEPMPALVEFDKAMLALPQNQVILDNVAEVLHALPDAFRKNDVTKRAVDHFNAQDAALQRQMAQQGLFRWGSKWIDQQEYAGIQAQEKEVKDKLGAMQKEFDANNARLVQIERAIQDDQVLLNTMQQQSFMTDPRTGNAVQLPLPQRYYDVQRDQGQLESERALKQRQQVDLQREVTTQQQRLPQPRYGGLTKAFDVEGYPGAKSAPGTPTNGVPATAPSPTTAPATTGKAGGDY